MRMTLSERARSRRIWRRKFNYALYIPAEMQELRHVLESGGAAAFKAELTRLARLGSANAAAILAFLELRGAISGQPDVARALELCVSVASNHNAYVDYVQAWVHWLRNEHESAVACLRRSGARLFPPAALDLARFVWHGWGIESADRRVAMELLQHASALGHRASLLMHCAFCISGALGPLRLITGYVLYPIALARYACALWFDPFSERVFLVDLKARRGVFKAPV